MNQPVAPFDHATLQSDILKLVLLHARSTSLLLGTDATNRMFGRSIGRLIYLEPDEDVSLAWDDIKETNIAQSLQQQFDLAYLGLLHAGASERLEPDTMHSWIAAWLRTMADSVQVEELGAWGIEVELAAKRAWQTSETANARLMLERERGFFYFGDESEEGRDDLLSVRQVALLSGMEEMSVRTAISRKGPNQLPSVKEEQRTYIRAADARTWLEGKGRRIPLTHKWAGDSLDLASKSFDSLSALGAALHAEVQRQQVDDRSSAERLSKLSMPMAVMDMLVNNEDLSELAVALHLPPDLLALRAQQARLNEQLQLVDASIKHKIAKG